jgi:hypothetical protein
MITSRAFCQVRPKITQTAFTFGHMSNNAFQSVTSPAKPVASDPLQIDFVSQLGKHGPQESWHKNPSFWPQ